MGNLTNLFSYVVPPWVKWLGIVLMIVVSGFYGYVKGLQHETAAVTNTVIKTIIKQGEVTTKVVTKYQKIYIKQKETFDTLEKEGQQYAIDFKNDGNTFNSEFVRLFNDSVQGTVSSLPSGEPTSTTSVETSELLNSAISNNKTGHIWEARALSCEEWNKNQEELNK